MERAIAYYRVSTKRQQRSGFGIDAKRATVARFAEGMTIVGQYVEVETGKEADALDRRLVRQRELSDVRRVCSRAALLIRAPFDKPGPKALSVARQSTRRRR
jgi:DNA invertase Pin-like site-specific DNA recombinase